MKEFENFLGKLDSVVEQLKKQKKQLHQKSSDILIELIRKMDQEKMDQDPQLIKRIQKRGLPKIAFISSRMKSQQLQEFLQSMNISCIVSANLPANRFVWQWNSILKD